MKRLYSLFTVVALMASPAMGATTDYAGLVRQDIQPWLQSKGQLFGLSTEAADSLQWRDDYATTCTEEDYYRMLGIVSNPACYHCPTGYYRLRSTRGGYLYLEGDSPLTSSAKGSTASSIVRLERAADGGCYLKMQDLYLRTPMRGQAMTLSVAPEKFYPIVKTPAGQFSLSTRKGDYAAISAGSSSVTGGTVGESASLWTIEPATEFTVAYAAREESQYLGTLYVPFACTPASGVYAYTVTTQDGQSAAHVIPDTIPAATPVLLMSDRQNMPVAVTDPDHADSPGIRALRNDYADLSYHSFNRAFLLYSGMGKDNTTYYRTNLSTVSNLYFWQQALVILAVEDRYDFRGDTGCASLITDLLDAFVVHEGSDWKWNNYNDDLLWAGLAFIRGYKITGQQRFLTQALHAWNLMYDRGWDDQLSGGIWWSVDKEEKSGLSNNPAICMAAYLYDVTGDESYLQKAIAIYNWVYAKLRRTDGSVAEKIDANGTLSTSYNVYNIGTFIEGAAALFRITGEVKYRTVCQKSIEYVMINKVTGKGILSAWKEDGTWQSEFARGMAFYLKANPADWNRRGYYTASKTTITYYKWLRKNADAAWETRDTTFNITGCQWEKVTPPTPRGDRTWECDACVSAVVMTNVVPQVQPGDAAESYVDLDNQAYVPPVPMAERPDNFTLDNSSIMRAPSPVGIVCVGNSITEGYGLSTQMYSWPAQLQNILGPGYMVTNCGVSGTTMSREATDTYWKTGRFTEARNANPQILIIALGTNDADNWRWVQYGKDFKADYLAMVEQFRQNGRNPVIYCTLAPPLFPLTRQQNLNVERELIPKVRELAAELNAHVIDFHTSMVDHGADFPDNLHPNAVGAGRLARLAADAILQGQCLTTRMDISQGTMTAGNMAIVPIRSSVTMTVEAPEEGTFTWSGPNGFTATGSSVTIASVTKGGAYKVRFTGKSGLGSAANFLVSLQGSNAAAITPYLMVNGGSWQQVTSVKVPRGATVNFGPQYQGSTSGTWTWAGPDGFHWVGRSPSIPDMSVAKAGRYACTYTDADGKQSTTIFTLQTE